MEDPLVIYNFGMGFMNLRHFETKFFFFFFEDCFDFWVKINTLWKDLEEVRSFRNADCEKTNSDGSD